MGIFIAGGLVTLIVTAALVLLVYAAVLDGRDGRTSAARRAAIDGEGAPGVPLVPLSSSTGVELAEAAPAGRLTAA